MSGVPFVYPRAGSMLVMGDGPELFVFSGANDGPLWRKFTDGVLIGVGANHEFVVTLDSDGRLVQWRGLDGAKQEESTVEAPGVRDLVMRADGTCAVLTKDQVLITSARGGGTTVPAPGVAVVAWGPKQELAVGSSKGDFQVLDPSGKPLGSCSVGGAISGITWRAPSQWLVATGTRVVLVSADGKIPGVSVEIGAPVGPVACSEDGAIFAVLAGTQAVAIGELATNRRLGTITYQRDVSGIGFGQGMWLAIGLSDAEANRIDLMTGQLCRTEPHIGMTGGTWAVKVDVEPMRVRQASTTVRSAGKAIAVQIEHGGGGGGGGCLKSCLIFALLTFVCSGCSGVLAGAYYYYYNGGF